MLHLITDAMRLKQRDTIAILDNNTTEKKLMKFPQIDKIAKSLKGLMSRDWGHI